MFLQIKAYLYAGVAVVGLLALGYSEYKAYSLGEDHVTVKYEKTISEINAKSLLELQRQNEIADKITNMQKQTIAQLQSKNQELETIQKENEIEAAKDPHTNDTALGASSVLRIGRIK